MSIEAGPDFAMEYEHPVLSLLAHGNALAESGAEPDEIETFAYMTSEERRYTTIDRLAIRGMVVEVHGRHTSNHPYLPGLEFLS